LKKVLFISSCTSSALFLLLVGCKNQKQFIFIYNLRPEVTAKGKEATGSICMGWFNAESEGTLISMNNPYSFIFSNFIDNGVIESDFLILTAGNDIGSINFPQAAVCR